MIVQVYSFFRFPAAFAMAAGTRSHEAKMFPKPKPQLLPNTYAFESEPMVKATGFREYDARWLFNKEINLMGVQALGMGLGALIAELGVKQEIVTGHDFRSYSASIKYALISGLMAAGCKVHDIGLAVTPMAYFAQFDLDVPCVAMVTASHNDNGWTGVKMGANRPLTFGPDEMTRLKQIVLNAQFKNRAGGAYEFHQNFPARYIADLTSRTKLKRKLKVVVACGNGTAGAFAPQVMQAIGCEVVPLDTELDYTFPKYNPNPEDWRCCTRSAMRCWPARPMSGSVLMVTATAAASSTTPARRFSPTRSASCWRATCRRSTRTRSSWST